jgi:hypothetical protein
MNQSILFFLNFYLNFLPAARNLIYEECQVSRVQVA